MGNFILENGQVASYRRLAANKMGEGRLCWNRLYDSLLRSDSDFLSHRVTKSCSKCLIRTLVYSQNCAKSVLNEAIRSAQ